MPLVADPTVLSAPVARLAEAVAGLSVVEPAALVEAAALEDLRALVALRESLDAHLVKRLRDMDDRRLHDLDALPSTSTWVAEQTTSIDAGLVTLARRSERLPVAQAAVQAGRLSVVGAQRVGTALEKVRRFLDRPDGLIDGRPGDQVLDNVIRNGVRMCFAEAVGGVADDDPRLVALVAELESVAAARASQVERVEAAFVVLATRLDGPLLRESFDRLIDALLPQQLEDRSARADQDRAVALVRNTNRPGWRLEGDLDDETGELAFVALTAAMAVDEELPQDTAHAAARREGDASAPRPRSKLVLRHDALMRILTDWLGSGIAGQRGKVVPHISVTCGLDALHEVPGALPAVAASGVRLSTSTVRTMVCDSAITRFVLSIGHQVIEMSHTVRTLKPHERKAKLVEVGGRCQAAGCTHPPGTRLIPHHPEPYALSGSTSFYDTVMVCERCHAHIHVGEQVIRLRDGRLLGPAGWVTQLRAA